AGIHILGGHTVEDTEPKFGMAVSGIIHPNKIIKNSSAQVGDVLVLTKAIGSGILSTAMKKGLINKETIEIAVKTMAELNGKVSELFDDYNISACTDITGFGLLGHLKEMTSGSNVNAEIYSNKVPLLPEVEELATAGVVPGGTKNNMDYVASYVEWGEYIPQSLRYVLCDAQTSGGLLISMKESEANKLIKKLNNIILHKAVIIGKIVEHGNGKIYIK
ncbi:MAG: selenide, water dikinase SelD, partial [Bacteroidales bacterium]|nr:selenide, water dikinase SelD [Bacteroidales bacterium]